jgi:hypothetical protein
VRRRFTEIVRLVMLLGGCVLLAALFARLGPGRILALLSSLGANFLVLVAFFAAHEYICALAVGRYLPGDSRPPPRELLRIRLLGEAVGALTRTGPFTAEPARAWLLAGRIQQGMSGYSAAVGELMANSGTSAAVNVAVAGWMLLTAELKGPALVLTHLLLWGSLVYVGVIVGTVASRARILGACVRAARTLPVIGRWLRIDSMKLSEVEHAISSALPSRPAALVHILLLEISAQALLVCEVYWAVRSMGVAISVPSALFLEVMTRPVSIVQFVGATEAGYAVVFSWLGIPATVGFTLSLAKTLRSLTAAGLGVGLLTGISRSSLGVVS